MKADSRSPSTVLRVTLENPVRHPSCIEYTGGLKEAIPKREA